MLVGAYLLVRSVHLTVYAVAATGEHGLRHQVAITWLPTLAGGALLVAGALHGLFMILAIGESVVAIGVGAAEQPISAPLLVAAILGVAAAVGLWWLYFDVVSLAAEHRSSAASRCIWPGSCCSSAACTRR